ncbi:hypothetical protein H0X09_02910 [Candidatus Saccharibacteria bacterium]|nr:hypothetical protein [Candidatus Saccharibacteria bacterium]
MLNKHRDSPALFAPKHYHLVAAGNEGLSPKFRVEILGEKTGKPSKRITLQQRGIKIHSAVISYKRKNIQYHHQVVRTNHIKSFDEVRIHTAENLYPGEYVINIYFTSKQPLSSYQNLSEQGGKTIKDVDLRTYLPIFKVPETNDTAQFKVSYTNE